MADVTAFQSKDGSVLDIISNLSAHSHAIEEIYCVVKLKTGTVHEKMFGDRAGLAFAIIILQKYLMESIDSED